jgi:AraC-like DNA-binding protein
MLFQSETMSLSKYIQYQRLEACRRALRHPDYRQRSTTDIALQWGFSDVSHFHRCFKASYGVTPRQYKLSESP